MTVAAREHDFYQVLGEMAAGKNFYVRRFFLFARGPPILKPLPRLMSAYRYLLFYKPFQVLSQFSQEGDKQTLADYFPEIGKDIYPVGRLDYDSEGLP